MERCLEASGAKQKVVDETGRRRGDAVWVAGCYEERFTRAGTDDTENIL